MQIKQILLEIKFNEFISVDLETTGLNPSKDEIIEISAIRFVNGEIKDEFTTLIKPIALIPKKITSITGINDSMVSDAPKIVDVFKDFLNFLDNKIIVAHNIDFDIGGVIGTKITKRIGIFIEGRWRRYWDIDNYELKTGINYSIF